MTRAALCGPPPVVRVFSAGPRACFSLLFPVPSCRTPSPRIASLAAPLVRTRSVRLSRPPSLPLSLHRARCARRIRAACALCALCVQSYPPVEARPRRRASTGAPESAPKGAPTFISRSQSAHTGTHAPTYTLVLPLSFPPFHRPLDARPPGPARLVLFSLCLDDGARGRFRRVAKRTVSGPWWASRNVSATERQRLRFPPPPARARLSAPRPRPRPRPRPWRGLRPAPRDALLARADEIDS